MSINKQTFRRKHHTKKKTTPFKLAGVVAAITTSAYAFAVTCVWVDPMANTQTAANNVTNKGLITASTTTLQGDLTAMDTTIAGSLLKQNQIILDDIKTLIKQKAIGAQATAQSNVSDTQTVATAIQAVEQGRAIKNTQLAYGVTGQGHNVCAVLQERQMINGASDDARKSVPSRISTQVYAAPGSYGNPQSAKDNMLQIHKDAFCTQSQAASGLCTASQETPGLDLQAATLYTEATPGSITEAAQNQLINQMVGLPDRPVPKAAVGSAVADQYQADKLRKDALTSPAIASLKAIQSEFNPNKLESDANGSLISQYRKQVSRYLGTGQEYKDWNSTLVRSEERGVMKELLQIKALDIAMAERQYRQNERMEATLASLVAMEDQLQDNGLGVGASPTNRAGPTPSQKRRTAQLVGFNQTIAQN